MSNIEKHVNNFYKKYTECKDSNRKIGINRYYENKDKISSQQKKYEKNRDNILLQKKKQQMYTI